MTEDDYTTALLRYVGGELLPADARTGLTDTTPLMESGLLDSLRVALLLTHIRDEWGLHVPPARIDAHHFRDIRAIAAMLHELSSENETQGEPA
ncbi:phosphopantetheine-binding protein [Streptomyces sp. Act-28]